MTPTTVAQTSCHVRRQVRQQLKNIGGKNGRISQLIRATRPASSSGLKRPAAGREEVEEPTPTAAPKRRVRGKQTVPVSLAHRQVPFACHAPVSLELQLLVLGHLHLLLPLLLRNQLRIWQHQLQWATAGCRLSWTEAFALYYGLQF